MSSPVAEGLRRVFGSWGVTVHFKPRNTSKPCLGSPKDKISKTRKCHTVYNLPMQKLQCLLHRGVKTSIRTRLQNTKREPSPVAEHARATGHSIHTEDIKILDTDSSWHGCGIRESVYIRKYWSSLNRYGGRYHLPAVYNTLFRHILSIGISVL